MLRKTPLFIPSKGFIGFYSQIIEDYRIRSGGLACAVSCHLDGLADYRKSRVAWPARTGDQRSGHEHVGLAEREPSDPPLQFDCQGFRSQVSGIHCNVCMRH